ncbi:MAG TPA: serine protease [Puia sp.]|nr:serine protease [Puia sp.]
MEELNMLESVERYIRGEMLPEEKAFFDELRKNNQDLDQLVVEHTEFLHQLERHGERSNLKNTIREIHDELIGSGQIKQPRQAKVVRLWVRYRKVVAVAASIAGITALAISGVTSYFSPKTTRSIDYLSRKISILEQKQNSLNDKINRTPPKVEEPAFKLGGTGFMIDSRGYLMTNAHVVENATNVIVQNNRGQEFKTRIIYLDASSDLAVLKINDSAYKSAAPIPYGISKGSIDLGEAIFTLGYPRDEIVYGEGYLSAKTGFRGDTLACQISVAANPGNSGGPVLDKNGDVIGILSNRQAEAQGAVFAIRSKYILRALDEVRQDSAYTSLKLPQNSTVKNLDRVQQIKRIEEYIYMVKSY